MSVNIVWDRTGSILLGILSGRIDSSNAPAWQDEIDANFAATDKSLILDFADVSYMSSAGLRVIIGTAKRLKDENKDFRICAFTRHVRQLIEISGLEQVISVYPSRADAFSEFGLETPGQQGDADQTVEDLMAKWNPAIDTKVLAQLIDQDILGENFHEIALFAVDKHELINGVTLSAEAKEDAVRQIHAALNKKMETLLANMDETMAAIRLRMLKTLLSEADAVLNES